MAAVSELIRKESDGTISFGDYTLGAKSKLGNFEHCGDLYKVKTFKEIVFLYMNQFRAQQLIIFHRMIRLLLFR